MKRILALVLLAAVPVVGAALGARGLDARGSNAPGGDMRDEKGKRVVQIVYESDTRGYYLPCG